MVDSSYSRMRPLVQQWSRPGQQRSAINFPVPALRHFHQCKIQFIQSPLNYRVKIRLLCATNLILK
jgi:hypothetical protein